MAGRRLGRGLPIQVLYSRRLKALRAEASATLARTRGLTATGHAINGISVDATASLPRTRGLTVAALVVADAVSSLPRTRGLTAGGSLLVDATASLARTRGLTATGEARLTVDATTGLARTRGLTVTPNGIADATLWTIEVSQSFARARDIQVVAETVVPVIAPPTPATYLWQVSPVYPAPSIDADTGRPTDWLPTSVTVAFLGRLRVVVDHGDRTYERGIPVDVGELESASPYGDATADLAWPQVTPFDTVGTDTATFPWLREGANVDVELVDPNGNVVADLWSGFSASLETAQDETSYSKGLQCMGALYQADAVKHQPPFFHEIRDIGSAIAKTLNTVPHRRYGHVVAVDTGIATTQRGSRDQDRLTGYVADRLAEGTTSDGLHQWSVEQTNRRHFTIKQKKSPAAGDAPDFHFTAGTPGLTLQLSKDLLSAPRRIFAQAITPDGCVTQNIKTPNFHPDDSTPYPNSNAGQVIDLGTTDAGTDSGTGVTDLQRRLHDTFDTDTPVTGTYDSATQAIVERFQDSAGITVDGIVGPQTWTTLFEIGSNVGDLKGMYYAPFAEDSAVEPYLRGANGSVIGDNPNDDPSQIVVDRFEDMGEGLTHADVRRSAKAELARDHVPGVYGTITARIDPEETSRWLTSEGQILGLRHFEGTAVTGLYVVSVRKNPRDLTVEYTVDSKARDLMTVAAMMERDRTARLDRANRRNVRNQSKLARDVAVQYDCEAHFGLVPRTPLFGGLAVMVRLPFGERGECVEVDLTTTGPASPFAVAVFGQPTTVADVNTAIGTGDPTAATSSGFPIWTEKQDALDALGFITAWGMNGQRCGYDPLSETTPNLTNPPVTGKFSDQGGFSFSSQRPPWLWVYIYSPTSCFISGQFKMAPIV